MVLAQSRKRLAQRCESSPLHGGPAAYVFADRDSVFLLILEGGMLRQW
jgi:hypothetical protein